MDNQPHISDEEFMKDAEEGLSAVSDKKRLSMIVEQINSDLHKRLEQKKARKSRGKLKEHPWIYLAVILIIFLIIMAWLVLSRLLHS